MKKLRPVVKFSDEKWSLKEWIISQFPENYEEMTYIEPFGGGADVLFGKNKSKIEIVNDCDVEIVNIFRAIRDEHSELIRRINLHKHCLETFEKAEKKKNFDDYLDQAVNELLLRKMSRNGLKKQFVKTSNIKTWKSNILELAQHAQRLKEVYIFNKSAIEIIKAFDSPDTLLYIDPPYLHENKVSKLVYLSAMNPENHLELYRAINEFNGKVVLSGCMSPLYKRLYKNWNMSKKRIDEGKTKKTEIIWKNF